MIIEITSGLFLVIGAAVGVTGAVGILRFPGFFTRLHAAGVTDTLCAGCILVGLMIRSGGFPEIIKLAFILVFLLLTSPTASHALAKAALHGGYRPANAVREDRSSNK